MASNRGRTRPERAFARALWNRGLRYLTTEGYKALFGRQLVGSPDLIFTRKRVLLFVDGCFWHGCPECRRIPDGYDPNWVGKVARTVERDGRISAQLREDGWNVIRVPEHDVSTKARLAETADKIASDLRGYGPDRAETVSPILTSSIEPEPGRAR